MNTDRKMVVGMFAVTLVTAIWLFRWDMEPVGDNWSVRLDRWTGEIAHCAAFVTCRTVEFDN